MTSSEKSALVENWKYIDEAAKFLRAAAPSSSEQSDKRR